MTPKEKASELVEKFKLHAYTNMFSFRIESNLANAKKCALIAVDEILNLCWNGNEVGINFWNEVKQEIQIQKL